MFRKYGYLSVTGGPANKGQIHLILIIWKTLGPLSNSVGSEEWLMSVSMKQLLNDFKIPVNCR